MDVSAETVIAIFGKRGSGKSYTLGVIAESLCARDRDSAIGRSRGTKGAVLFDTLNIFWSLECPLDERAQFLEERRRLEAWGIKSVPLDIDVWIPAGFRRPHTPERYRELSIAPSELSDDDLADLLEVDAQRDLVGQLLTEARAKAAEHNRDWNFGELLRIIEADLEMHEYYSDATIRAARQRVRSFSRLPLFDTGTALGELIVRGRLSVIELGEVPNSLRAVICAVLLRRIHSARAEAADAEKQLALNTRLTEHERSRLEEFVAKALPPCWVLIDEAQNILPASRDVKSSDAVVRFVREGRNFGLSFALTTQQPSAVDQRILAQADTIICHRLTVAQDIARMRDNLKSAEPMEVKLGGAKLDLAAWLRSLDPGCAIISNSEFDRAFSLEVRPRVTPHGGTGFIS